VRVVPSLDKPGLWGFPSLWDDGPALTWTLGLNLCVCVCVGGELTCPPRAVRRLRRAPYTNR
jgi:hypothetical protein